MGDTPDTEPVTLSICVATYLSCSYLRACLASIYRFPPSRSFEIVVVNDYSGDGTAEMVKAEFPDVIFIENQDRIGVCRAENMAFRNSRGRYIMLIDADAELIMDTIDPMMRFLEIHPDTGVVSATMLNPDGSLQPSGRPFPTARGLLKERAITLMRLPIDIYHHNYRNYEAVEEVDDVPITCLMMPRKAGEPDGFFDENIYVFYPDTDLCHRIKTNGWKIYQMPDCKILHHRGVNRKNPSVRLIVNGYRDELYYFRKWYPASTVVGIKMIQLVEIVLRMTNWALSFVIKPDRRSMMAERLAGGMTILKLIWQS